MEQHVLEKHPAPQLNLDAAHMQEHADHDPSKQSDALNELASDEPCTADCSKDHVHKHAEGIQTTKSDEAPDNVTTSPLFEAD